MKGVAALRSLAGIVAFLATWVLAFLVGLEAGDYWFWLGLLFGWIPGIVASNLAEKLWPLLLAAAAGAAWWVMKS
jgi:hypothetical protein